MSALELGAVLAQQQVLVGMAGAAVVGGVMFGLRQVPGKALMAIRELATVTLEVENDEMPFKHLTMWLAKQGRVGKSRRVKLAESYDYDANRWAWTLTLGGGWHVVFHRRRPLLVHRRIQETGDMGQALGVARRERLTLINFGRDQAIIREILEEARRCFYGDDRIDVFCWMGGDFMLADKLLTRSFDTVFLPGSQKQALSDDVERFLASREVYRKRGTPWRRGYLFEGPPGTGKTTLIHVLAGLAKRSIYVINLNSVSSDAELMRATNGVGQDGILVIEDIDSAKITHDRDAADAQAAASPVLGGLPGQTPRTGPSLSGLLNAIDGVTAREGRMLCITSNHAEKLDPALVRPGRIDLRMLIEPLAYPEAFDMFLAFRPEGDRGEFLRLIGGLHRLPMPASTLQNLLQTAEEARVAEVAA